MKQGSISLGSPESWFPGLFRKFTIQGKLPTWEVLQAGCVSEPRWAHLKYTDFYSYRASQVAEWKRICLPMRERQEMQVWLGSSLGEGNGNPLQYSCLGNPMGQKSLVDSSEEPMGLQRIRYAWVTGHTCIVTSLLLLAIHLWRSQMRPRNLYL